MDNNIESFELPKKATPPKKYNTLLIIIGTICLILIVLLVFILIKNKNNDTKQNIILTKEEKQIVSNLKEYYKEEVLFHEDNLKEWNITSISYLEDYEGEENLKYYEIKGNFNCKDDSSECLYTEEPTKIDGNYYSYKMYVGINEDNKVISVTGSKKDSTEEIENEEPTSPLKDNNKYAQLIKDYYVSQNQVDANNISSWSISDIERENVANSQFVYYIAKGSYQCKDNSSNCISLSNQKANQNNGYDFTFYIELIEDDKEFKISRISETRIEPVLELVIPDITSLKFTALLKDYYKEKKLINSDNTTYWILEEIKYHGYRKSEPDVHYYYFNSRYMCKDKSSDCVYVEQTIDGGTANEYFFKGYVAIKETNDNYSIINLSSVISYDDMEVIDKILIG